MKRLAMILAAASVAAYGNTGTVSATLEDGTFSVSFANHAHETNSLWAVYGPADSGDGTNGWAHVERLGTVTPETNTWTYAAPAGWGETVRAVRFVLSSDPFDYAYDYRLDFIRSKQKERIVLDDFDLYMNYRLCLQATVFKFVANNPAFFTNRDGTGSATPYFTLFAMSGTKWRFDYNDSTGTSVTGVTEGEPYDIAASSAGLYVNGTKVNSLKGSVSTAQSQGRLEFFCGNTTASSMANNAHHLTLYGAQIYDAPTGGSLLVNLVPMVKGGRAGLYDTKRNVYYFSDTGTDFDLSYGPSRIDPFFASALCKTETAGPELFMPGTPMTVSDSITNAYGGILDGVATLTLTGENDWGGSFTVANGTLVAAFGQGLAATDCLRLVSESNALGGAYGGWGGWNGRATASLGSGAGQIFVPADGTNYLAYCAADGGELEVDIGGAGATWTPVGNYRRLLLNGAAGAGTLRFKNPILLSDEDIDVRVGHGTTIFEKSIQSAQTGADARTMTCGNVENGTGVIGGTGILRGAANSFLNFTVNDGAWVFDEGTTNTVAGGITMVAYADASLLATNATVEVTGGDGGGGWLNVYGGKAVFAGGSLAAGGFRIGEEGRGQSSYEVRQPGITFSGKVRLAGLNGKSYGSGAIYGASASAALTVEGGADVEMHNLTFLRRQIFHKGGTVKLQGSYGILRMGEEGTSRYILYTGAELAAPGVGQDGQSASYVNTGTAEFVIFGGTLGTTSGTSGYSAYFRDFNGKSHVYISSTRGGTFRADHATSITNGMETAPTTWGAAWNYSSAETWLTAPAFKKTGSKRLTLSGTNTYACATDVAEGRLLLAGGENPGVLPTNGVVRVTGGTLDLGGNAQEVRGLVGTAGAVTNGALVVKEGIYPGGAGAVGSFACGATLDGVLHVDVDETGACDKLVAHGALDVSRIDLALPASLPAGVEKLQIVEGAAAGAFRSVDNLPSGWGIVAKDTGLWAQRVAGTTVIFR